MLLTMGARWRAAASTPIVMPEMAGSASSPREDQRPAFPRASRGSSIGRGSWRITLSSPEVVMRRLVVLALVAFALVTVDAA
ncbi:MAG: hypothetical protein ACREMB_07365, partial [Candidatus Rokuibacteriota bacterium]